MYIYHVLINPLSTHMICINLNTIFYTHVEQSPTYAIYVKYYLKKDNKKVTIYIHMHAHSHNNTTENFKKKFFLLT